MKSVQPKNHLYDGWFYRKFIDPALLGIRKRVAGLVPQGATVLDVGCGTGDQLIYLSNKISQGLGIELSETLVQLGNARAQELQLQHIDFQLHDATDLSGIATGPFDIATCSMMIHEMPPAARLPVIREMTRLGSQVILVDWICPQPQRWKRWSTRSIEFFAGREHYAGYRSFMATGGIPELLKQSDLKVLETQITSKGTIQLWVCERA
jgi:SAM-dependent methyltransferase